MNVIIGANQQSNEQQVVTNHLGSFKITGYTCLNKTLRLLLLLLLQHRNSSYFYAVVVETGFKGWVLLDIQYIR